MTKKVITPASGSAQTIYYETNDDNTVVKFSAGGRTVTSHSKTDSFGRKVFDELQLGTDFVSRQFVYHAGKVTAEHKTNAKVKSSATTQLVSQIILSNGTTLSYGYDAEERITSVVETYTVDETQVTNTTIYTYDALGQLETETKDGKTTKFEYDNYGNITAKGVVDETGEIVEETKISYVYGNDTWKDLLTSYNGQTITYDAQGNPTTYLGHTLTWEKGRQLNKFVKSDGTVIDYTYNANGIRTSKTVNGVKHEYTLDGTKILRETWNGNTLIPLYDNEDGICGILYNNVPYYFIKNLHGDVIAIVDKDAKTVARYSYDAWGAVTSAVTNTELTKNVDIATINPFRYRGYYYYEDTNLYYLQSRYYNSSIGRFLNSDDVDYLGMAGTSASYNLLAYCENNSINFVDYFGHAPSLSTLTRMHNAVVQSAQSFLFSVGTITTSEVRTCNNKGKYNGRMDIYSYISNRVWEVKRNNSTGISDGLSQLGTYTSSYVYSLYHARFRIKKTPRYGNKSVYGSTVVSNYLVTYRSYSGNKALIVYDYMSLERAAELVFSAVMATSAAFAAALSRCAKKTREKVTAILAQVKKFLGNVGRATQKVLNAIGEFLKKAGPIILLIIAIIIFLCTGIPVPA